MERCFNKKDIEAKFVVSSNSCSKDDANNVLANKAKIVSMAQKGPLAKFIDDIRTFLELVRDYFSGKYTEVPFGTIAGIVFALLYVLSPFDFVPDILPIVGLLDDAAMVGVCLAFVGTDVDQYRRWKKEVRA